MKKEFKDRQDERFTLHKKEFNLSEKIRQGFPYNLLREHDVKEFIRLLKKRFKKLEIVGGELATYEINKLAGDELIK